MSVLIDRIFFQPFNLFAGPVEIVDILVKDQPLRQRIIDGQNARVETFREANVQKLWAAYLQKLELL